MFMQFLRPFHQNLTLEIESCCFNSIIDHYLLLVINIVFSNILIKCSGSRCLCPLHKALF